MAAEEPSNKEFVREGLQFIKVTLETGKKVTLVYAKSAFEKASKLMAEVILDYWNFQASSNHDNNTSQGTIWAYDHPMITICCGLGIASSIAVLACPESIAVPILVSLGFTAEGVKSGTLTVDGGQLERTTFTAST